MWKEDGAEEAFGESTPTLGKILDNPCANNVVEKVRGAGNPEEDLGTAERRVGVDRGRVPRRYGDCEFTVTSTEERGEIAGEREPGDLGEPSNSSSTDRLLISVSQVLIVPCCKSSSEDAPLLAILRLFFRLPSPSSSSVSDFIVALISNAVARSEERMKAAQLNENHK